MKSRRSLKQMLKVLSRWPDATERMMMLEAFELLVPAYSLAE
jgi:hypothetical protein